jgi:hypothetical protein
MPTPELTDHGKAALTAVLRATIAADPFAMSPRRASGSYGRSWRSWSRR